MQKIYVHEADDQEEQKDTSNDIDTELLSNLIKRVYENLRSNGYSVEQAKNVLKITEPFNDFEPLIDEL